MKLLLINSEYPPVGGGAGNASANIARCLVQLGNEVVVVTSRFDDLPRDETFDGVRVLRGPAARRNVDRSTAFEQVRFILGATIRCLALFRGYRPAVVLAFFGLPSGAVALILKALFGTPYVVSLRGGDVPGFRPYDFWLYHRIAVPFLHMIWHSATAIVANSEGLRRLANAFDSKAQILVIPNGVESSRFWRPDRAWSQQRLLSVGRVVHQKGLDLAATALAGLRDLQWEWRIAGDGPEVGNLRRMLAQIGLQDRIRFLGWLSAEDLAREYQEASLFLFPSRHEGMPNALLEAMAGGLPSVATRIAGNEELVSPEVTGLLVPPEDATALRESLRRLLVDPTAREMMGRAAHASAAADYDWMATTSRYQKIFVEVAG